ncbi:MAG TPA: GNAT family N-acetyltransferase [Usitatibacter sp.]|jgi:GNAT superfamily N-acetyltransferase|nr:GNAT family N-acetyltransferase [Usitatibacter sp.]
MASVKLTVKPLTPENWPDLEKVFGARGCSVARGCWCMYYRRPAKMPPPPAGVTRAQRARRDLRALTRGATPPGLIGYRGQEPVGWISLGPREDYAYLERSRVMAPVDEKRVWSIICFVVPSEFRGEGVAHELLRGAVAWARKRGVKVLEAYPVIEGESLWFGTASMFTAAGFEEVARRKPDRPVMRLEL